VTAKSPYLKRLFCTFARFVHLGMESSYTVLGHTIDISWGVGL